MTDAKPYTPKEIEERRAREHAWWCRRWLATLDAARAERDEAKLAFEAQGVCLRAITKDMKRQRDEARAERDEAVAAVDADVMTLYRDCAEARAAIAAIAAIAAMRGTDTRDERGVVAPGEGNSACLPSEGDPTNLPERRRVERSRVGNPASRPTSTEEPQPAASPVHEGGDLAIGGEGGGSSPTPEAGHQEKPPKGVPLDERNDADYPYIILTPEESERIARKIRRDREARAAIAAMRNTTEEPSSDEQPHATPETGIGAGASSLPCPHPVHDNPGLIIPCPACGHDDDPLPVCPNCEGIGCKACNEGGADAPSRVR